MNDSIQLEVDVGFLQPLFVLKLQIREVKVIVVQNEVDIVVLLKVYGI